MNDIYDIRLLHFIINLFTEYLQIIRSIFWVDYPQNWETSVNWNQALKMANMCWRYCPYFV